MTTIPFQHVARAFPSFSDETVPDDRLRRGIERLKRFQWFVDDAIPVPLLGTRIGADTILGLIPVAGDVLSAVLQTYLLLEAMHLGVSRRTLVKMCANIGVDLVLGIIPVIGDILDAGFKATRRNVDLVLDELNG